MCRGCAETTLTLAHGAQIQASVAARLGAARLLEPPGMHMVYRLVIVMAGHYYTSTFRGKLAEEGDQRLME